MTAKRVHISTRHATLTHNLTSNPLQLAHVLPRESLMLDPVSILLLTDIASTLFVSIIELSLAIILLFLLSISSMNQMAFKFSPLQQGMIYLSSIFGLSNPLILTAHTVLCTLTRLSLLSLTFSTHNLT